MNNRAIIDHIELEQWCVAITAALRDMDIECKVDVRQRRDQMLRGVVYDIRAYLTAKSAKEVIESKKTTVTLCKSIEVPDGWWQHFKHDWTPTWLLGWVPDVRYKTIEVKHSEEVEVKRVEQTIKVCPHIKIDPMHRHFQFLQHDSVNDEMMAAEQVWKLRRFVRSLVSPIGSYDYGNLSHECSQRVIDEAKKVLGL